MADFYVKRIPFSSAWDIPRRTRNPVLKLLAMIFSLLYFVVLLAVGLVVLIIDLILTPFRLLLRAL